MNVARPHFRDELRGLMEASRNMPNGLLAAGLRRSYGDSGLNDGGALIDMSSVDRFISLDHATGLLHADAGISLADILRIAIPFGYFLPVTPGSKFITLGGAIANDVHGKNHHVAGTIGRWVRSISLLRSDGEYVLDETDATGLFSATIGGLGLTGVIERASLQLIPIVSSSMDVETVPFGNLEEFFSIAADSDRTHDYTVAWVDCLGQGARLGRGVFTRGRHSSTGPLDAKMRRGPSLPMDAPSFMLNHFSISAFNEMYYRMAGRPGQCKMSFDPFFYPLDAIGNWNKLYGKRGFYQYQSVIPPASAALATAQMLKTIAQAGLGSFLAVLKTFSAVRSPGLLSFPMEGTTLALDFANQGVLTMSLLDKLDAIVREAGGRLYPAKDGRLPPTMFRAAFPALEQYKAHIDPMMSSTFWRRMSV
jgi:FAD/FMN-containing dehydrogenase